MRKIIIPAIILATIVSCTKTEIVGISKTVVTSASMSDFNPGKRVAFFSVDVNKSPLPLPVPGENQIWDLNDVIVKDTNSISYLPPIKNDSFPSATYMLAITDSFGSSTSTSNYYGEVSPSGFASLGKKIKKLTVVNGGASLTLPEQTIKYSKKLYSANFPMHYKDSFGAKGVLERYKLLVTVPNFYPANTPGTETWKVDYSNIVIASGKLRLKGYPDEMPVLVLKNHTTSTVNYLINGQVPPAPILAAAGGLEGEVHTSNSYSFYSPLIGFVGSIYVDNKSVVTGGTFRRNF